MDQVLGLISLIFTVGILRYAYPAYRGSRGRTAGYVTLAVLLPLLSWPWLAHRARKVRSALNDAEE